jgi:hypothetical protein
VLGFACSSSVALLESREVTPIWGALSASI